MGEIPHYATADAIRAALANTGMLSQNDHHEQGIARDAILAVLTERYPVDVLEKAIRQARGIMSQKSVTAIRPVYRAMARVVEGLQTLLAAMRGE